MLYNSGSQPIGPKLVIEFFCWVIRNGLMIPFLKKNQDKPG